MSKECVTCPKCGRKLQTEVTTVIRENDETAWKALLSKTLNTCTCPDCGTKFMVERPLIYRDIAHPFIVYYVDAPDDGNRDLEQQIDAMAEEISAQEGIDKPVVRLTLTIWDFIEKIFIWRMGYDDRLIEFAKQQLFRNTDLDKLSRTQHRLLLDFSNEDSDKLVFIVFDRETNAPVGRMHVPLEEFHKLTDEFQGNEQLMHELEILFPTCLVSVERLF